MQKMGFTIHLLGFNLKVWGYEISNFTEEIYKALSLYSAIGIRNVYLSLEGNYKPFTETIDSLFSYFNRII